MAKVEVKKGKTDVSLILFIQNSSVSTGAGLAGLAFNTANLICYYLRPGATPVQISLVTQTVDGAHTDGGFVEVDATNMPGLYRLDLPDAVCASGVDNVVVMLMGADNMVPTPSEIQLEEYILESPSQYKADVSSLALEATLTAIKGAGWTVETLKTIYDAIQSLPEAVAVLTYNDLAYNMTGYELISGAVVNNDPSDTMAYGGDSFELRPDSDLALDANFEFSLGTSRVNELRIRARMEGNPPTAQCYTNIYAYDFLASTWVLISDATNRIPYSTSFVDQLFALAGSMQDTDGTVKIRYLTNRTVSTDILYIDFHAIEGVNTGITVAEIAEGIWAHNIRNRVLDGTHRSAGYFLARTAPNWARVDSVVDAEVTFSANDYLQETDHIYAGRSIQFHKGGEYIYEIRKCIDNIGRVFTLDRVPILVDGSAWHAYMLPEINDDISNLDVAISTRAPAAEYDIELAAIVDDLDNPDQYKATGFSVPNEYDAALAAIQADLDNVDQFKATGFSIPSEYDARLAAIQADLDNPDQYKADVSHLAPANEYDAELAAIQADLDDVDQYKADLSNMPTVEEIWVNEIPRTITMTATEIAALITEDRITQVRGNTWVLTLSNITLTGDKFQFAIKKHTKMQDDNAVLLVDSESGLLVVTGTPMTEGEGASLTYVGTTLTLEVDAEITALLPADNLVYGIQSVSNTGVVVEPYGGVFVITADVVRSTD